MDVMLEHDLLKSLLVPGCVFEARDGDHAYRPVCMGEVWLHREGNTFRTESTRRRAVTLEPRPDLGQIHDIVLQTPKKLHM